MHNTSNDEVTATSFEFGALGEILDETPTELPSKATTLNDGFEGFIEVRGPSSILVAGYESGTNNQIACHKKTKR